MVTQFPLDPMHLLDLGVTKKILLSFLNNKMVTMRLNRLEKEELSLKYRSFAGFIPREFSRKPRGFEEVLRWKATEFRQFILYTGIAILKDVMDENTFYHFLLLHCAYRLLSCRQNYLENISTAEEMLKLFVEQFPLFYNENSVTFNVHSLLHIAESVRNIGYINEFSAYPFENYMQHLKKIVKKPTLILQQIYNRINIESLVLKEERFGIKRNKHGRITSLNRPGYCLTAGVPNNFCSMEQFIHIQIIGFTENNNNELNIIGKRLLNCTNFFDEPVMSMCDLGIFLADVVTAEEEETFNTQMIKFKLMSLPYKEKQLFIPILHTKI